MLSPRRSPQSVTSVEVLGHYQLRLGFSDGSSRDVDLAGELRGPVFEPLVDPDCFARVRVDDELGTVVWPTAPTLTRSSCTATSSRPRASRTAEPRSAPEVRLAVEPLPMELVLESAAILTQPRNMNSPNI